MIKSNDTQFAPTKVLSSAAGGETLAQPLHPDHAGPTVDLEEGPRPAQLGVETVLAGGGGGEGVVAGPGHVGGDAALPACLHPAVAQTVVPGHPSRAEEALAGELSLATAQPLVLHQQDRQGDGLQEEVGHHAQEDDGQEAHCHNH